MRAAISVDRVEFVAVLCSLRLRWLERMRRLRKLWSRLQLWMNWCFLGMQMRETIKPTTRGAAGLSLHHNVSSSPVNHSPAVSSTESDTKKPHNTAFKSVFSICVLVVWVLLAPVSASLLPSGSRPELRLIPCLLNLSTRAWHLNQSRRVPQTQLCAAERHLWWDERHQAGIRSQTPSNGSQDSVLSCERWFMSFFAAPLHPEASFFFLSLFLFFLLL